MSSEDSDSSSDEYERVKRRHVAAYHQVLTTTIYVLAEHTSLFNSSTPCMTSKQTGHKWLGELVGGHPGRFHNAFRMPKVIFFDLLQTLEQNYGLQGSRKTASREVLAITLYVLSHNETIRKASERFQHSTETASRYFSEGLHALLRLAEDVIVPQDRDFVNTPQEITGDARYMPFFKDCIGAIDGTHVDASIPVKNQVPYIGRHGVTTQNVMAVCDFNMCFTFAMAGWEGSAYDSWIFNFAISNPKYNFPHPPRGKYYLVDAGYPLQIWYIKPYPDTRYHLPDFARGNRPVEGLREIFNQAHSSLRSVIERTFGVWKKKWAILRDMHTYSFKKQTHIVLATMALHNFIRRHPSCMDPDFRESESQRMGGGVDSQRRHDTCTDTSSGVDEMLTLRESIAQQLYDARRPPILVSDILWQYGEYQSTTPANVILRRKELPEKEDKAAPSSTPLEVREAAYLAARERIFSLHESDEKESVLPKSRKVPVVAQRMIAHALGQKVSSLHIHEKDDKNDDSTVCAPNNADETGEISETCKAVPQQQKGAKFLAKTSSSCSSLEPELKPRSSAATHRKTVNPENLEKERIGAAKRIFAQALGIASSNRGQDVPLRTSEDGTTLRLSAIDELADFLPV